MRWLPAAAVVFLFVCPAAARASEDPAPLPSRPIAQLLCPLPDMQPADFDLIDLRAAEHEAALKQPVPGEIEPHSHFGIKQHIGFAAGYDNGVLHGSLGFYMTVAEWGRWNYGVPSPALGFGRYQAYDPLRKRPFTASESTLFISLASVHYRAAYIQSLGMNLYINLEQIFDLRQNMAGSQVGVSFSRK
jgi:hypothetical protein